MAETTKGNKQLTHFALITNFPASESNKKVPYANGDRYEGELGGGGVCAPCMRHSGQTILHTRAHTSGHSVEHVTGLSQ